MKNLLLICLSLLISNFGISQKKITTHELKNENLNKIIQKLNTFNENATSILESETDICSEFWETDTENNLTYLGEGKIQFEIIENVYIANSTEFFLREDNIIDTLHIKTYFRDNPIYNDDTSIDSSIITTNYEGEQIVAVKFINLFENDKLVKSETYFDFDYFIGMPVGLQLIDFNIFYYENSGNLKSIAYYSFDFFDSFSIVFTDSIDFTLNSNGLPTEGEYFIFDSGDIHIYNLIKYYYNSDNQLDTVEYFNHPENWAISEREIYTYSSDVETYLYEWTFDEGNSWFEAALDSTYLSDDLPYNYPKKIVSYFYDSEWKINNITTYKHCTGTSNIRENNDLDVMASLKDNYLILSSKEELNDSKIILYDINGRIVYYNNFDIVPEYINIGNLSQGIYILDLIKNDKNNCQKLVNF